MQLHDIFSGDPFREAIETARAACDWIRQQNRRDAQPRVCTARQRRDRSLLFFYVFILISSCLSLALCGCVGGQIIGGVEDDGLLQASPDTVNFGSVSLGTTASASVSLVNQGSTAVQISQISLSGQAFSITSGSEFPITVVAGATYSFSMNFAPATMGATTGELTVSSNSVVRAALVIGLSGTGMAATPIVPPVLNSLTCANDALTGAGTDSCVVTLSAAALSGGLAVNLASSNAAVIVPTTVTVAAGATTAGFTAAVSGVSTAQAATLTASANGVVQAFALQLSATGQSGAGMPTLSGLSCANGSITGTGIDSCTVTLNGAAGSGGLTVSLASNNSAVTLPATVTVAAGAVTAGFTANVSSVNTAQTVTLTAIADGVVQTFALQLNASGQGGTGVPALNINATSLTFGDVILNTPATQLVTLSSTGTAGVTVSAATVIGSGFSVSGATLPLILSPQQTGTISVQFDPAVTGSAIGTLIIVSTSLTNPIATISLSGTGVGGVYQVDLSWIAPIISQDPVVGYNIYRSPGGTSTYQQLNPSLVTQTTYADTAVQNGQTYDYIVESVDASGIESDPSNIAVVPVP
jgi:hypothetical protein